jgi:hypothetical protein
MNGGRSQHATAGRIRAAFGLTLVTVANAALHFVAVLHLGVRIPLGFVTLSVPEPIPGDRRGDAHPRRPGNGRGGTARSRAPRTTTDLGRLPARVDRRFPPGRGSRRRNMW